MNSRISNWLLTILSQWCSPFGQDNSTTLQTVSATLNTQAIALRLPDPNAAVLPGVVWGKAEHLFSPAFWHVETVQYAARNPEISIQLGRDLREEVAACLLGGYGMPASLGLAAFVRLRDDGLLNPPQCSHRLESALATPLVVHGVQRRYRFPRQKARYLSQCLDLLSKFSEPERDREFRDALSHLPGIGLKTASWIVRNRRRSNEIAVIDVHIHRAGQYIGLFSPSLQPQRHYRQMEERFVAFADALGIQTWLLDAVIWDVMRGIGTILPQEPYVMHANPSQAPSPTH